MTTGGPSEGPVTVLLTDIEGSTDLQSRLGDAAAWELVRDHDALVREAISRFAGTEIKTTGDGFLVSFASTRRALECACAIQRELEAGGSRLRVRMGLHAGEVIHDAADIHGAAISVAARIMAEARGGEILVSDLVRQLAGAAGIRFRERRGVPLKGLEGTWLLHEVVWRAGDPPVEAEPVAAAPSLVGRDPELAALRAAVDAAMNSRGRVALLAGEPGIGKTSLAVETAAYADARGARVLWGACWEGEGAPAFWPWIQALRVYATEPDDERLASDVGPGAGDILRLLPELAPRLPEVSPGPDLDPEQARFRLFDAVASLLCRASSRRPTLVVIDDLHWCDESSLLLLGFVAAQLATNSIVIVGTYRDTEVGPDHPLASLLHDATRWGQILPVAGLDTESVARLMASTAGTDLRPELSTAVHRKTAGNPLFVGEVTRLLATHDALDRFDVSVGVPAGVREVIERRLVRLPQRCIELLTLAAVVGEEFSLDVVASAGSTTVPEVVEHMEAAVEARAARDAGVGRYRFAHALFREVLYEGQGTVARARLHLRVANALETRSLERGDVPAAELASHFSQAAITGEGEKALRYAVLAGQQATAALAYAEAVGHLERALAVLDLVGGHESQRTELLLDLGAAQWRAGDRPGAQAEIHQAVELARRTGRGDVLARAALALRSLGGVSGTADNERVLLLEEAKVALGEEESALRARLLAGLAQERYHTWLHQEQSQRAGELASEAVALARRLDDPATLAASLLASHDVNWLAGREAERLDIATELLRVAREVSDRELATEAVLLQAVAFLELSDARGISRLEEFIHQADSLHQPHFDYLAATRRATLAMISGDVAEVDRHLDDARRLAEQHDEPDAFLVESAGVMARDTLADTRRNSVELSRRAYSGRVYEELALIIQCLALLEEGEPDRARQILHTLDLDDMAARYVHNYGWLYVLAALAEAAAWLGERELMERIEPLLIPHRRTCIVIAGAVCFFGSVAHYLGLMYAATGRSEEAREAFDTALAAYDRLGATGWAERTHRAMAAIDGSSAEPGAALCREGGWWLASYAGREARVRDAKGVRDLAVLVSSPGREIPAAELVAQGMASEAGADVVLDERARREFRQRLADLDDELAEAEQASDIGRLARIKAERDAIAHELAAALGLGGRARTLGDPAERARKAVSARIRDAIDRIGAEHPDLGSHLRASVRTGTFCCYEPAAPVGWRVTDATSRQT